MKKERKTEKKKRLQEGLCKKTRALKKKTDEARKKKRAKKSVGERFKEEGLQKKSGVGLQHRKNS